MSNTVYADLFSTLISDIKTYSGNDPLLPWLRGIKKMRESLPPQFLKEKLPRFLQKCATSFEDDRCYRNDLRYIRVWIQLMDFVDDPRGLLKAMEKNRIGLKKALFYEAYALYYEKVKKFGEAEKMYHLGVQNLAEPVQELQKAYEQFLRRMDQYKKRKTRREEVRASVTCKLNGEIDEVSRAKGGHTSNEAVSKSSRSRGAGGSVGHGPASKTQDRIEPNRPNRVCNDETVVVKFVDTAIVGKSEAENACHHGLVDPTINLQEAMSDINNMFREPLEWGISRRSKPQKIVGKENKGVHNGFDVFVDDSLNGKPDSSNHKKEKLHATWSKKHNMETKMPHQGTFEVYVDVEDENRDETLKENEGSELQVNAFVFPRPNDEFHDVDTRSSKNMRFREDTVVGEFVGSAIGDQSEVENACHHGLVEPTINLKEAMDTINSMFGKPLDFVKNRSKKQGKFVEKRRDCGVFSILPDDDLESQQKPQLSRCSSNKLARGVSDMFEPTMFTKQAMDDINEMFGKSLDF